MVNTFQLKKVGDLDVFFRNPNVPLQASNQPEELERVVKFLTNEDFEDYEGEKFKRKLKHPENFDIIEKYFENCDEDDKSIDKYTCLCSEKTCSYLVIVKHIPTNIYIALGSVCYKRFDEKNGAELYYHCDAKRCHNCKTPLVFRKTSKFIKNTDKKCNGSCFGCFKKKKEEVINSLIEKKRVCLNVSYDDKDDAKLLGAW